MNNNQENKTDNQEDGRPLHQEKQSIKKLTQLELGIAVVVGILGAVLGAIVWYLVAKFLDIQVGYLALLIGFLVGFGMKFIIKGKGTQTLGIIAGVIALFGILFGNGLLWYYEMPRWAGEELVASGEVMDDGTEFTQELVESQDFFEGMRLAYPFWEYVKDDLTSTEDPMGSLISWVFYILAVYTGYTQVYPRKKRVQPDQ